MGFFRRTHTPPVPAATREVELPPGDLRCTEAGCYNVTGRACVYVDRRGRSCPSAWCPQHRGVVNGLVYCRRHAGVIRALPDGAAGALPDLDNRSPSLVAWVAHDVDAEVTALVTACAKPGQTVKNEPPRQTYVWHGQERVRSWESAWKLFDHVGIHLWVSLDVEEDHEDEICIRVGGAVVARLTPPWIAARTEGRTLSPSEDAVARREFTEAVVRTLREAISARPPDG